MQNFLLSILALAGVVLLFAFFPRRGRGPAVAAHAVPKKGARAAAGPVHVHPFEAVSIHPGEVGCRAVKALRERRFLVDQAPPLPLPECDASQCTCTYLHHFDRRLRRRDRRHLPDDEFGMYGPDGHRERRHLPGRRKSDWAVA